jgi:plastocyanin
MNTLIRRSNAVLVLGTLALGAAFILSLVPLSGAEAQVKANAAQQPATTTISIDNFSFTPMDLTVPAGTQITWTNKDDVPHTIVSIDHQFKSKTLDTDETFSFTFQNPGTYEYFCSIHPRMTGKIIVK